MQNLRVFKYVLSALLVIGGPAHAEGRALHLKTPPLPAFQTGTDANSPVGQPIFTRVQAEVGGLSEAALGKWRLVRTPGPERGTEVVSIMHTADTLRSDPDFAGMMIRCRSKSALQIAFIVITPFAPRAQPQITVSVNQSKAHFQGEPIPPGQMVSLPSQADVLAKGPWVSGAELTADIERDGGTIHGVVQLNNLADAIAYLQSNCADR
jgi:hypothetical protein